MNKWLIVGIIFTILFAFLIYKVGWRRPRVVSAAQDSAKKPQPCAGGRVRWITGHGVKDSAREDWASCACVADNAVACCYGLETQ